MATLTWLGHSAFRVESDNGERIYVDPFLTGNPSTPDTERSPERVDVIAVTHGHGDHVGDAVALELLGNPRCVPCHWGTFPVLTGTPDELAREAPDAQIERLEPGGTIEL